VQPLARRVIASTTLESGAHHPMLFLVTDIDREEVSSSEIEQAISAIYRGWMKAVRGARM
jgi:hypothetical protein